MNPIMSSLPTDGTPLPFIINAVGLYISSRDAEYPAARFLRLLGSSTYHSIPKQEMSFPIVYDPSPIYSYAINLSFTELPLSKYKRVSP